MKYLLGLLALLLAIPAVAGTTSMADSGWPPKQFQSNATVIVQIVDLKDIPEVCHLAEPPANGGVYLGCALLPNRIVIYNPNNVHRSPYEFTRVFAHELGHLEGWPGNHPRP